MLSPDFSDFGALAHHTALPLYTEVSETSNDERMNFATPREALLELPQKLFLKRMRMKKCEKNIRKMSKYGHYWAKVLS